MRIPCRPSTTTLYATAPAMHRTQPGIPCCTTHLFIMRPFLRERQKQTLHAGVRTGLHYLICLYCVCVTSVFFADCESCTKPISTNPGSTEAGEYGLTRETCFVARRLEVVAVAGLLWTSWCVLSGADFFLCECFRFFSSSNAHGLLQV